MAVPFHTAIELYSMVKLVGIIEGPVVRELCLDKNEQILFTTIAGSLSRMRGMVVLSVIMIW